MVFLALILMAVAAIVIDYFRVRGEKKAEEVSVFDTSDLNHIPA